MMMKPKQMNTDKISPSAKNGTVAAVSKPKLFLKSKLVKRAGVARGGWSKSPGAAVTSAGPQKCLPVRMSER